ncbi:unnamed protein product [Allacma fusca]|uniref:Uncharacterized protein n=1 Tax=Allacma fusca TaxID=39272 RepID=A0A8J2JSC4_9HEXA|nr:unnamed protein product [Allacma fusca]
MTTTRQIEVNGYVHVQACTLIGKISKFSNRFNATGKYNAPGWTGEEVFQYLNTRANPPIEFNLIEGSNYVESFESGIFFGYTYLNNVMVVLDPTYNGGCMELDELFYRLNRVQTEGMRTGRSFKEEEQHIESRLAEILRR